MNQRRSNQSILKEISSEYSLEGLMLKLNCNTLATWCEERTHWKRPWCWERLKTGGEGDHRGWDAWMASLTWWMWVWASSRSWWWTGKPGMLQFMGSQRVKTWLSDWTELTENIVLFCFICIFSERYYQSFKRVRGEPGKRDVGLYYEKPLKI